MISAKIILHSINPAGVEIITFEVTYPRFLHPEFMTHRDLSRNAASSRAIPIWKMIRAVINNPAIPEFWGSNQKGMQAGAELTGWRKAAAKFVWRESRWASVAVAWMLDKLGVHKQISNRVLEPWSHITVVVTTTKIANLFTLRAHPKAQPKAQPEFQVLAYRMLAAHMASIPLLLNWGEWHRPYITSPDYLEIDISILSKKMSIADGDIMLTKISAARCARVSYLTHNGVRDHSEDLRLYSDLASGDPLHASALEHPARAVERTAVQALGIASNFHPSWEQFRKQHPRENITKINFHEVMGAKPNWITV
jgi:hypothetical protein